MDSIVGIVGLGEVFAGEVAETDGGFDVVCSLEEVCGTDVEYSTDVVSSVDVEQSLAIGNLL